ncbi:MAG TPA: hypothetical protein VMS14_03365, partial [Ilumatobacteraceae bacterium]|nr:hypothetical protein [Ilumatobacteraceae bacterium]
MSVAAALAVLGVTQAAAATRSSSAPLPAIEIPTRVTSVEQTVSTTPTTSADGRLVAYAGAPLDPADTRSSTVYLLDRADGSTRELTPLLDGVRSGASLWPVVSADGCTVTIISEMSFDLFRDDDEGSRWDVYRTVLPQCGGGGDWELVSATNGSGFGAAAGDDVNPLYPPAVSGEGSLVAYTRQFSPIAPDVSGVELVDLTVPVGDPGRSQPLAGSPAAAPESTFRYHGVREPAMSTDGTIIAFTSDANAAAPLPDWGSGPQPGGYATSNVYVWNRADLNPATAVRRVSVPTGAETGDSSAPAVSGDGSRVAFVSNAINLVAGAALPACTPECVPQVYLVDLATGAIRLGSRVPGDPATAPTGANAAALQPALDQAGEELAFVTRATNLFASHSPAVGGPTDGDIVVAVPDTGEARRASTPDGATPAPAANSHPRLSANGRVVVFDTLAGAAYGHPGVSGRQVVVVGQDPALDLADLDMGTVAVTFPGPEWFLVVRNDGPSSFVPAEVTTDSEDFLISGGTCMENAGTPVPPGGTCTVNLMFMPAKEGRQAATLTVAEAGFGAVS